MNPQGVDMELTLVGSDARTGVFSARANLRQDDDALYVEVYVTDDDLVFSPYTASSDHIQLWLAPPPNRYTDNPGNFFYSEELDTRYWISDERLAAFDESSAWMEEVIEYSPNACFAGYEYDEVMGRRRNSAGVIRLDINPYGRQVTAEDTGWTKDWTWQPLVDAVTFEYFELTGDGYSLTLKLPVQALGLVPNTGVELQRLAIDAIGFDSASNRTVASTAPREHPDDATAFNHIALERPLTFRADERLPFLGRPLSDLPEDRRAIFDATPPYFVWNGENWSGARIGKLPGEWRGHDICTAGLGEALIPYEGEFSAGQIEYRDYPLDGWKVEVYQRELYINDTPADFTDDYSFLERIMVHSDAGEGMVPRTEINDVFALDENNLALLISYGTPDRGRFAKGPCAGGSTEFLDLVVWSPVRIIRHELVVMPTCAGSYRIAHRPVSETEFGWDEYAEWPTLIDAERRKVVIDTNHRRHEWWLVEIEGDWLTAYRAIPVVELETEEEDSFESLALSLSHDLRYTSLRDEAEIIQRLRAIMDQPGANLDEHMLLASVCQAVERVSLDGLLAMAELLGDAPTCLISHPQLFHLPSGGADDDDTRLALAARLIDDWALPEHGALGVPFGYLADTKKRRDRATLAYAIAALLMERVGGFGAEARHVDRAWGTVTSRLLSQPGGNTWSFVLEHAVDDAARDSIVEHWLAQYTIDNNWLRFKSLYDRHPLPRDSYLYLQLFAADRPRMLNFLQAEGLDFEDTFENGDSLLHLAAEKRYAKPDRMALLLDAGVPPDIRDAAGATPLQRLYAKQFLGYQGDHEDIRDKAQALIDAGADVNARDGEGRTSLFHAISKEARYGLNRPLMLAGPLIEAGAEIESINGQGESALHRAAALGVTWLIEPLIEHGADVNAADAEGLTPLMRALTEGQVESVYLLKTAGADLTRTDNAGKDVCDYLEAGEDLATAYALHKDFGCLERLVTM